MWASFNAYDIGIKRLAAADLLKFLPWIVVSQRLDQSLGPRLIHVTTIIQRDQFMLTGISCLQQIAHHRQNVLGGSYQFVVQQADVLAFDDAEAVHLNTARGPRDF